MHRLDLPLQVKLERINHRPFIRWRRPHRATHPWRRNATFSSGLIAVARGCSKPLPAGASTNGHKRTHAVQQSGSLPVDLKVQMSKVDKTAT